MNSVQKKIAAVAATVLAGGAIVAGAALLTSAQARPAEGNDWGKPAAQGVSQASSDHKAPACLDIRETGRFHVVNDHTLLVYNTWQDPYLLDVGGPCRSMDDLSHFGFEVNGTTELCRAHDAFLLFSHDTERPVRCIINGVKVISRAEAAKLDE
ncbi:DUF6491 family protein [Asticcacaulis solisilvae]|uniref:DUF6491 family protein n=1 Tax=Asticcacaulis solisilvae TaxID=1217274 RepID=UPI003FD6E1A9